MRAGLSSLIRKIAGGCIAGASCVLLAAPVGTAGKPSGERAGLEADKTILAAQILSRWEPVVRAAGIDAAVWHEQIATQLGFMSVTTLQTLDAFVPKEGENAHASYGPFAQALRSGIMASYMESRKGKGNLKLGSTTTDQVFIPVIPCRVVDTRNVGGPIAAGFARNFKFYASAGTNDWADQGGASGNAATTCPGTVNPNGGAPSAAIATVTVVNPTAAGNFVAWGGANPVPLSSVLNWNNPGDIAANTTVIPAGGRAGTGPGGMVQDFAIAYNGPSGQAQVVVDVFGYFVENKSTALDCVATSGNLQDIPTGATTSVPVDACPTGYTGVSALCSFVGTITSNWFLVRTYTGVVLACDYTNNTGATHQVVSRAQCCRVSGL